MSFNVTKEGQTLRVFMEDSLIVSNRQELRDTVLEQLDRGERNFLLDLTKTRYIDSSGLGVLISLSKRIRDQRGTLRLTNLNADLVQLFALTKLDKLFQFGES